MIRFALFGFPIVVHWMFWVNMALLSGAIGAVTPDAMQAVLASVVAGFISILIHELGHAFTMRYYGDRQVGVLIYGFGGVAQGSRYLSRGQDIIVSAAGPAIQIAAGLVAFGLAMAFPTQIPLLRMLIGQFIWVSIFWAVLNLMPIIPLDGGHISRAIFGPSRLRGALILSLVFAVGLGLLALSVGSIISVIFMGMFAFNNWKELQGEPQTPWMHGR